MSKVGGRDGTPPAVSSEGEIIIEMLPRGLCLLSLAVSRTGLLARSTTFPKTMGVLLQEDFERK